MPNNIPRGVFCGVLYALLDEINLWIYEEFVFQSILVLWLSISSGYFHVSRVQSAKNANFCVIIFELLRYKAIQCARNAIIDNRTCQVTETSSITESEDLRKWQKKQKKKLKMKRSRISGPRIQKIKILLKSAECASQVSAGECCPIKFFVFLGEINFFYGYWIWEMTAQSWESLGFPIISSLIIISQLCCHYRDSIRREEKRKHHHLI